MSVNGPSQVIVHSSLKLLC